MNSALQGTRYGEALRNAARDQQAKRARHENSDAPDATEWPSIMCYLKQQLANGAFERLMRKAKRANPENNVYHLGVKHFEILDLGCRCDAFGQGVGQGGAMTWLLECGLVEPVEGGLYAITPRGRHIAEGGG